MLILIQFHIVDIDQVTSLKQITTVGNRGHEKKTRHIHHSAIIIFPGGNALFTRVVVQVVGMVEVGFVGQEGNTAECGCGMLLVVCTCVQKCVCVCGSVCDVIGELSYAPL